MLQNPCKTLGFMKNMVYKIPPGGGGGKPYPASGLLVPGLVDKYSSFRNADQMKAVFKMDLSWLLMRRMSPTLTLKGIPCKLLSCLLLLRQRWLKYMAAVAQVRSQDWKHLLLIQAPNDKRLYLSEPPPAIADNCIKLVP